MTLLYATAISLALWLVAQFDVKPSLSPDGRFYITAAGGVAVPTPYRFRWLPPALCGQSQWRWQALTGISLIAWGPLMAYYLDGLGFVAWQQLAGAALLCGLPALFRLGAALPVLVDPPAFALGLAASGAWLHGHLWAALGLAVAAGACKETAPIFAAVWALHPALLIGLVGAGWWKIRGEVPSWARDWLERPFLAAWQTHRGQWLDWRVMVLPWGVILPLAVLAAAHDATTLAAGLGLALGYGSLLMAQDRARLFGWAAPAVIPLALLALSPGWALAACAVHVFNPYRGA